jgi:hypothetical protein
MKFSFRIVGNGDANQRLSCDAEDRYRADSLLEQRRESAMAISRQ